MSVISYCLQRYCQYRCVLSLLRRPAPPIEFFADPLLICWSWEAGHRTWPRTKQRHLACRVHFCWCLHRVTFCVGRQTAQQGTRRQGQSSLKQGQGMPTQRAFFALSCIFLVHFIPRTPGSTGLLNPHLKWIKWRPILLAAYTISGGLVWTPLTNRLRVQSTSWQGQHPNLDPQDLPAVRLLAWADVVSHGGSPRWWRVLEIHVDQHRGKDEHQTSVWRLTEGDPERPAAPLVWEPPWHGGSLCPFGAIQSIDRP